MPPQSPAPSASSSDLRLSLTGIVLVGGRSSRMQAQPKPLAVVGNKLILARIADALRPLCVELIAVVRPDQDDPTPDTALALRMHVVQDAESGAGPLAGLCAGLQAATTPLSFVAGGDHPFLSSVLISAMAMAARGHAGGPSAVVPRVDDMLQPLHAVYPTGPWSRVFCAALAQGERSPLGVVDAACRAGAPTVEVWDRARIESHDPALMSLVDVDTPTQLARARNMADWRTNVRPGIRPPGGP